MFLSRASHCFARTGGNLRRSLATSSRNNGGVTPGTLCFRANSVLFDNAFQRSYPSPHQLNHNPRKFFSSEKGHETELQQQQQKQQDHHDHRHHLPRNEKARRKLQIGFASLSTLPFSSPPQQPSQSQHSHSPTLDPRTTILLTALRGSVLSLDCPSPPAIDGRTTPSSAFQPTPDNDGAPCWHANRLSQVQIADSLEGAWKILEEEEDDGEAKGALEGGVTVSMRLGYRAAVCVSEEEGGTEGDGGTNLDYREREGKFPGDARVSLLYAGSEERKSDDEDHEDGKVDSKQSNSRPPVALVHNLSKEYVLHSLKTSPLVQRYKLDNNNENSTTKNVRLVSLAHNPETQIAAYLISNATKQTTPEKNKGKDAALLSREAREYMKKSLTSAFVGYEQAVRNGYIDGYGVCSNGLSLPESHDMAMSWRDILECAVDAIVEVNGGDKRSQDKQQNHDQQYPRSSLKVIRLPGNVLETRGLDVSKEICSFFGSCHEDDDNANEPSSPPSEEGLHSITDDPDDYHAKQRRKLRKSRNILPKSIQVHVTRPLTAYPFGGTGIESDSSPGLSDNSGLSTPPLYLKKNNSEVDGNGTNKYGGGSSIDATHPIRILDYRIESGPLGREPTMAWTNHHYASHGLRPSSYQPILNAVLSHFDAESILEASRTRELTVEERETLDGCKLLRDMIHDLDASLDDMRSFAAYEEYLMNVAVPLIYGSFEGLDEESAGMLQLFFRVHGMAVRMVVARWTRELLLGGWKRRVAVDDKGKGDDGDREKDGGAAGSDAVTKDKDQEKKIAKIWKAYGFGDYRGGYDISEDVTLQDFALRQILEEEAVRGVVVGCSSPEHALEAMRAADASGVDTANKKK